MMDSKRDTIFSRNLRLQRPKKKSGIAPKSDYGVEAYCHPGYSVDTQTIVPPPVLTTARFKSILLL